MDHHIRRCALQADRSLFEGVYLAPLQHSPYCCPPDKEVREPPTHTAFTHYTLRCGLVCAISANGGAVAELS
jgi:hypothetical protein